MPRVNTDEILREFGDWRKTADLMKAGRIAIYKSGEIVRLSKIVPEWYIKWTEGCF